MQDAAAALPARLLGDVRGKTVADLCAAPGGKTAQLAAGRRAGHRRRPLGRAARPPAAEPDPAASSTPTIVEADAALWQGGPFDAVLVDAPCSSTGTIRRHPDIPWLKSETDLAKLAALQTRLLDHAATLVKPGGTLVYCTCSLEREEGEDQVAALLGPQSRRFAATRSAPRRSAAMAEFLTAEGELRTLPCHWPDADAAHGRARRLLRRPNRKS